MMLVKKCLGLQADAMLDEIDQIALDDSIEHESERFEKEGSATAIFAISLTQDNMTTLPRVGGVLRCLRKRKQLSTN